MQNKYNLSPEQIERIKGGCAALRANTKKATKQMRDKEGGRCCLAVLYDYAQEQGANLPKHSSYMAPPEMAFWYGLNVKLGDLAEHNDGFINQSKVEVTEKSHAKIADLIEKEYLS